MTFVHGRGCNYCHLTGYRGRIGVYELLTVDEELADAIRRDDLDAFAQAAETARDYVPLVNCALDYAARGVTSLDEVVRLAGGVGIVDDAPEVGVPAELLAGSGTQA